MLALVKKPRIKLTLDGEGAEELLAWIEKKYEVVVLSEDADDELVPIENTAYYAEMEKNRRIRIVRCIVGSFIIP